MGSLLLTNAGLNIMMQSRLQKNGMFPKVKGAQSTEGCSNISNKNMTCIKFNPFFSQPSHPQFEEKPVTYAMNMLHHSRPSTGREHISALEVLPM